MGGQQVATRGGMIHLVLTLCRQFEDAFAKAIDGGKGGGCRPDSFAELKHCKASLDLTR